MILVDHKRLARLMLIEGVSHRVLAREVGYKAHSYIGRLARGEVRTVGDDAAVKIARRLNVGVGDLFLPETARISGRHDHDSRRGQ
ncbi:helix-turn-helix transcriptional regulator [Nocardia brasiliensis]|uniref:helix-turn-helix transcriptional regulator n=1 Tax=Nocardia brasiliensis TaxID=37326 RepID=UPI0024569D43|nr:helix-turn-helix transcriptional regulator [Nocardia brasiliensis]